MQAGPKGRIKVDPLVFKGWPKDRAKRRLKFIRNYVLTPKGKGALKPFRVRDWQKEIIEGAFSAGVRSALVSLPRANGKTSLAAALAVAELFVGDASAEVVVVASDERQARICLNLAKRMIELNPVLSERTHIYADKIFVPETGSTMIALPADPAALHGWDASLLIVDELHVVSDAVWEAVTSASGKRPESLTLAISTPSTSSDCVMWRLVEHGRAGGDPSFFFREYCAPDNCDVFDRSAWAEANPALGDFLAADGLAAAARTLREPAFRQLRLGQWVKGADAWLPFGAWEALKVERVVAAGSRIVLAFDGSASGDSTALVAATVEDNPYIWPIAVWENPNDQQWRVPRREVADTVAAAFAKYDVVELAADPWGWRSELEQWANLFGSKRVVEFNTAFAKRMAPATDRFYAAVVDKKISHNGDSVLSSHMSHCVAHRSPMGDIVHKDKRNSKNKIDAAIAAIVSFDRAKYYSNNKKRNRVISF